MGWNFKRGIRILGLIFLVVALGFLSGDKVYSNPEEILLDLIAKVEELVARTEKISQFEELGPKLRELKIATEKAFRAWIENDILSMKTALLEVGERYEEIRQEVLEIIWEETEKLEELLRKIEKENSRDEF